MTNEPHSLLRRQLKRLSLGDEPIPDVWTRFIDMVNEAYVGFDDDRTMLERSLDLSSQELLQANSEMRAVFRAFPDLFIWIDRNDRIISLQSGDDSYLYLPSNSLIGKLIRDIPIPTVADRFDKACKDIRANARLETIEYELTVRGGQHHFEARLLPLVMGQVLVIIRDITESRQAMEERLRSSKLESVGLLAGGIAHDFNNILTAILANVSLARSHVDDNTMLDESLQETEMATERAADLTKQLLTFSSGGSPITASASAADLIRQSVIFALHGSNVRCVFDIADGLFPVQVDSGQISQVINNLVINADQAMPDGGIVTIVARNVNSHDSKPPLPTQRCVSISITDEGDGIAADNLERIFDPYFTTKKYGSGLGLTSSYAVIQKHGGDLTVRSVAGEGTTFVILLPAAPAEPAGPRRQVTEVVRGQGRVLVMDDEEQIRKVLKTMLSGLGYNTVTASDGAEAIRIYSEALADNKPFDVVIMDLTVPGGMGGTATAAQLRIMDPSLKAIASSGYYNDPVMASFKEYGFDAILPKPFNLVQIGGAIAAVLKGTNSS